MKINDITEQLAELLYKIGWNSPCDAQWTRLDETIPEIRELLNQHSEAE